MIEIQREMAKVATVYNLDRLVDVLNTVTYANTSTPEEIEDKAVIEAVKRFRSAASRQAELREMLLGLEKLTDLANQESRDTSEIEILNDRVMIQYSYATDNKSSGRVPLHIWGGNPAHIARHKKINERRNIHHGHYSTQNKENAHLREQNNLLLVGNFDGFKYLFTGEYYSLAYDEKMLNDLRESATYAMNKYGDIIESSCDKIADYIETKPGMQDSVRIPVCMERLTGLSLYSHIGTKAGEAWLEHIRNRCLF